MGGRKMLIDNVLINRRTVGLARRKACVGVVCACDGWKSVKNRTGRLLKFERI